MATKTWEGAGVEKLVRRGLSKRHWASLVQQHCSPALIALIFTFTSGASAQCREAFQVQGAAAHVSWPPQRSCGRQTRLMHDSRCCGHYLCRHVGALRHGSSCGPLRLFLKRQSWIADVRVHDDPLDTNLWMRRLDAWLSMASEIWQGLNRFGRIGHCQPAAVENDVSVLHGLGARHATVKFGLMLVAESWLDTVVDR
jgi:hypothetical protein